MIEDALGYLWLGTENGVVKYNGYDCKVFNLSNGLPTADVWLLLEDKKGKIWLGDFSSEIGYIYHNEYHRATAPKEAISFFPAFIKRYKDGIIFVNPYNKILMHAVGIVKNDSVQMEVQKFSLDTIVSIDMRGELVLISKDSIYKGTINGRNIVLHSQAHIDNEILNGIYSGGTTFTNNDFVFQYKVKSDSFRTVNIQTGVTKTIETSRYLKNPEPIYLLQATGKMEDEKNINVITRKNILQFRDDTVLNFIKSFPIGSVVNDTCIIGSTVTSFFEDSLWGRCLATNNSGLIINFAYSCPFLLCSNLNLYNYIYVGSGSANTTFWWNSYTDTLIFLKGSKISTRQKLNISSDVKNIMYFNADSLLVFTNGGDRRTYWYMPRSHKLINATPQFGAGIFAAYAAKPKELFVASRTGVYTVSLSANAVTTAFLDTDRYIGTVYDSVRGNIWAYNGNKIFIHGSSGNSIISGESLARFGINHFEKILIDNAYGNIFIKGNNKIIIYNAEKETYAQLFVNYNFSNALIGIYNNTLVIAGRFGVLFSKIEGIGKISEPVVQLNIKNNYYNIVSDMQYIMSDVILNTDKGVYKVNLPSDSSMIRHPPESSSNKYRLIVGYKDTVVNITSGDTLRIYQKKSLLSFDFIYPSGVGRVNYSYQFSRGDTEWHELNEHVLNIPQLPPAEYTRLSIIAYDDVFKSNKTVIYLYIMPYWWQTTLGKAQIVFIVAFLFGISVLLTRRFVLRNQKEKNLHMEMELKSIYSQINPHFIFNTLNSAMLMVSTNKMDEAYAHISKFSKLLRAYLKSSRNKLITIDDEVSNLRNYIELQQVRFKDKFEYEIVIAGTINARQVSIPSLLIQPFVENAINHGLLHKEETGYLKIEFQTGETQNSIICIITDDGIGRIRSKAVTDDKNKDAAYGNDLIKDLIHILNKYEKMNVDINYIDMQSPLSGTVVEIRINKAVYGA